MSKLNLKRRVASEPNTYQILSKMGYKMGKTIGKGTYSKVCLIWEKGGSKMACKMINRKYAGSDFIRRFLPREIEVVSKILHPNIVNVFKIIEINNCIYMLMDYCSRGDLLEYIRFNGSLEEEQGKLYFKQIVAAIEYLHDLDIAHRDLKCENIFITRDNKIKVGDFGFARFCRDTLTGEELYSKTFCGSAAYAAPEILQGVSYDPKMFDMWALGCVLYIMLTASMPFDDTNIKKMIKMQLTKAVVETTLEKWVTNSTSLKNLLANLLEPDVTRRARIKQVVNCIWLQDSPLLKYRALILSLSDNTLF